LTEQPEGGGAEVTLGAQVSSFAFSPDGSHTLFADMLDAASQRGTLEIADASGKVTTLAANVSSSRFLPDGNRVVYQTPDPMNDQLTLLGSVALDGSGAAQLGEAAAAYPSDSPGGSFVTWTDKDQIVRASPAQGGTAQPIGFGYPEWAS